MIILGISKDFLPGNTVRLTALLVKNDNIASLATLVAGCRVFPEKYCHKVDVSLYFLEFSI